MSDYLELHARSAFSFLRGASNPEDLAKAAHAAQLPAVALLDRDGVYGAPRLYGSARENGLRALVGAEITLADGGVLPLLAATRTGYQNLCELITTSKMTERASTLAIPRDAPPGADPHERKRPCFATWEEIAQYSDGLIALTGDEEGPVRRAWRTAGNDAAAQALGQLQRVFGHDRLYVELQRQRIRGEEREIRFLRDLAAAQQLPLLATGGVNYATRTAREVADVFTCLRHHTTLDAAGRLLAANDQRHVKSAAEMRALFSDCPEALRNSRRLGDRLEFTLQDLGYEFPRFPTPEDRTMDDYLHEVTFTAARRRYKNLTPKLRNQLTKELALIAELGFAGYFLIVWDICRWARDEHGILVQGRGSAANSSVCFVLGITAVDPMRHRLLFERFLSKGRVGANGKPSWPDIDLDFPSGERRESVIQEVYRRYGRRGAAMTANVITYRGRSTIREVGKVLGFGEDALDRFSGLYANGDFPHTLELQEQLAMAGIAAQHPRAAALARLYGSVRSLPRHLGQHSGGMVIAQGQLSKVVPLENASMPDRSVCQWDKDDCEDLGIIKIDFLGLGMMAVLQDTFELCAQRGDGPRNFADVPEDDPFVYERIRAADTVGVFQIESRAQMATLPRFKPRNLYDLSMQVAIIRPGPITGNLVHPLIRRRDGLEPPDYIDPSVEEIVKPILERTMGVILFQEQMLELSMTLAKFTGGEAEELRRAMGFTKGTGRLEKALAKLKVALQREGHNEAVVEKITKSAVSFAAYGFPESHAIGFAMLGYISTWLKFHRPAEFYASLLNNQPMGFYSPATLLQDARRGVRPVKAQPVCVVHSDWNCTVENEHTIRLGLRYVKGLHEAAARRMLAARHERPFASLPDFLRRTHFTATERRALAQVGAFNVFAKHRRDALWKIEAAWSDEESLFQHFSVAEDGESPLAPMTLPERLTTDFTHLGVSVGVHPMAMVRARLPDVTRAADLKTQPNHTRVTIAGSVICRQRPGTASGVVFISLEDETGIANAVVLPDFFEQHRLTITQESALRITGPLQNVAGVIHVQAQQIEALRFAELPAQASHDFH
ncbi:MAG: error-prone DNA polymerase [Opitutus sp.]|nr:error-prone DNA polymerase [Opitutus sp.]